MAELTFPRTMYRADRYDGIVPIQVVRRTAFYIFIETINHRGDVIKTRERIESWRGSIFDTWAEAHAALLARAQRHLESLINQTTQAELHLAEVKAMTDPTVPTDGQPAA